VALKEKALRNYDRDKIDARFYCCLEFLLKVLELLNHT